MKFLLALCAAFVGLISQGHAPEIVNLGTDQTIKLADGGAQCPDGGRPVIRTT